MRPMTPKDEESAGYVEVSIYLIIITSHLHVHTRINELDMHMYI